jgi:hypothetical protein
MIEDGLLQFTGTAGTAGSTDAPTTGTQTSTNILDMANTRDMGIGDDPALEILVRVLTAFASGTSLQVNLARCTGLVRLTGYVDNLCGGSSGRGGPTCCWCGPSRNHHPAHSARRSQPPFLSFAICDGWNPHGGSYPWRDCPR